MKRIIIEISYNIYELFLLSAKTELFANFFKEKTSIIISCTQSKP